MNDIRQKNVETYVRILISEKFKSFQGVAKDQPQDEEQTVCNCSNLKSENPAANLKDNGIADSSESID